MKERHKKKITTSELEKKFDEGKEDILEHFDPKTAKVDYPVQRINIDIPQEILKKVDQEAERVGVPRTSLIKLWIAKHVDELAG